MSMNRRQFIQVLAAAGAAGMLPMGRSAFARTPENLYDLPKYGNVALLHITDVHAQLNPIYFREPNVNLGIGAAMGKPPHLVGEKLLQYFKIQPNTIEAHAFTYLNYDEAAMKYGKVGGFAHLSTLVKKYRAELGEKQSLLLDGGDTWQGTYEAYMTRGMGMVKATNELGVDVMTGHWEFTYKDEEVIKNVGAFNGEFVCQNVFVKEDAAFDYRFEGFEGYNENSGRAFKPYTIKQMADGTRVAVIGQAFPYTPIANPSYNVPDWTFGIQDQAMQQIVDDVRANEKPDVVVVISHNGADVDVKMASRVTGIDVIFGGHTHDGIPAPIEVTNKAGKTLVTNAGSNGKFLGVMQLDVRGGKVRGYNYRLVPIFSHLIKADTGMQKLIDDIRAPYAKVNNEVLAKAEETLFRRGNFNGTFDQVICDAQRKVGDAQISLSPGFRWGTTVLPNQDITMANVMDQTCTTYPNTYVRPMNGTTIKAILEDVADNLFNSDPYYQQGGDMVRVGGMDYTIDPTQKMGSRISNMTLDDGTPVEANKDYKVAGWASVGRVETGAPIWDVVAEYLRDVKTVKIDKLNTPVIKNVAGNPGIDDYVKA